MTSRTKRVLIVVAFAVVASVATKVATYAWRSNAEVEYRIAERNLGYNERIPDHEWYEMIYGKPLVDRAKWEYRRVRHLQENLPEYGRALAMLQLSKLVDRVLAWIVILIFLLKVFLWALGKLFNNWVDGSPVANKLIESRMLDNGDIVIRLEQTKQGAAK